ncbi:MAG: hypothetical protein JW966_07285 [Anaerolineae bacterium]|nr:hypothetical protein [Anaerolineae bacterium]
MSDDHNLFDDDNLMPDWLSGADSEPPPDDSGEAWSDVPEDGAIDWLDRLAADSPPPSHEPTPGDDVLRPAAGAFAVESPAWEQMRGDAPSAPVGLTSEAPPWELFEGAEVEPAAESLVAPPWGESPGAPAPSAAADEPVFQWSAEAASEDAAPADQATDGTIDWSSVRGEVSPTASDRDEIPPGFTSMLPWRASEQPEEQPEQPPEPEDTGFSVAELAGLTDEQFTMDSLLSEFDEELPVEQPPPKAPSLRDRLLSLSPDRDELESGSEPASPQEPVPVPSQEPILPVEPSADDMEWMSAFGQAADYDAAAVPTGDQDDLDWLAAPGDESPPPQAADGRAPASLDDLFAEEPEAAPPAAPDEAFVSWLDGAMVGMGATPTEPEPEPSGLPSTDDLVPAWMSEQDKPQAIPVGEPIVPFSLDDDEEPEPVGTGDLPDWALQDTGDLSSGPAGDEAPRGIRRLDSFAGPEPAAEDAEQADLGWFDDEEDVFAELPEDETELTFDEWEQQQDELEREAQKTPEDRLLEEVPDWFSKIDGADAEPAPVEPETTPEKTTESGETEFVPDWYLGLEEQNLEEAPDWFQQLDYSAEAIDRPPDESLPAQPAEAPPTEEALPDWFKGVGAPAAEGADWTAAFGAPPADSDEVPSELDWMAAPDSDLEADAGLPLPDLDALGGMAEEPAVPGDIPDWLSAAAPGAGMMAAPEDIPFPELDLDQVMPPEDTAADFVERFEPEMPGDAAAAPVGEDAPDWLRDVSFESAPGGVDRPSSGLFDMETETLAEEKLDWLEGLSPESVAEPLFPEFPEGIVEPAEERAREPGDASGDASVEFGAGALDQMLSLYDTPEQALPGVTADADMPDSMDWADAFEGFPGADESPALPADVAELEALMADIGQAEVAPEGVDLFPPEEAATLVEPPGVVGDALWADTVEAAGVAAATVDDITVPLRDSQPEWVAEMRPSDLPVTLYYGGVEADVTQKQVAELPDQVRLFHETTMKELGDLAGEPVTLDEGPLAGIEGVLPLVDMTFEQEAVLPTRGLTVTPGQRRLVNRMRALLELDEEETLSAAEEDVLGEPDFALDEDEIEPEAAAPQKRPRRAVRRKRDRVFVSLLLLVGLLVPFLSDSLFFAADPPELSGDRLAAAQTVDRVTAGDYVLFAFEYGPTSAGELDSLVEAVLRDVLAQGAIPLTISTNAAGTLHAEAVIAPLVDDAALLAVRGEQEDTLTFGEDYVLLGMLPGEALGVRSLSETRRDADGQLKRHPAFDTDLHGDDTNVLIGDIAQDIALIVVIGEETDDVRTWVEQLPDVDVPMIALVTAAVEPVVTAYVNDDGYQGYLAGFRDAYSYNAARNTASREAYTVPDDIDFDIPNPEDARWHSMAFGASVAAGLITLGLVVNLFRAYRRRRHR